MINLADIHQLKQHLKKHNIWAIHQLGQHFLIDEDVLESIVHAADLQPGDQVLEIGPGPGVLSTFLVDKVEKLRSVELDQQMIAPWKDLMAEHSHAEIVHEDALEHVPDWKDYKLVANIPYYITSPLLEHYMRTDGISKPSLLVFLIQKEVAQRICDRKKPTLLSWQIRIFGEPELICEVPPDAFYPPPKVVSAVLKVVVRDEPLCDPAVLKVMEYGYKQPRKTLSNNLKNAPLYAEHDFDSVFEKSGVDGGLRPHQLTLDQWISLYEVLTSSKGF